MVCWWLVAYRQYTLTYLRCQDSVYYLSTNPVVAGGRNEKLEREQGDSVGVEKDGVNWLALVLSFIGAAFVGPALGAGVALIATVGWTILRGSTKAVATVGTAFTIAASGVLFLAAWWSFYQLARRLFD